MRKKKRKTTTKSHAKNVQENKNKAYYKSGSGQPDCISFLLTQVFRNSSSSIIKYESASRTLLRTSHRATSLSLPSQDLSRCIASCFAWLIRAFFVFCRDA